MTKPLLKILTGVIVLFIFIYTGVPFEIENTFIESICKVLSFGLVFFLLYILFKQVNKLSSEGLRIGGIVFLGVFSLFFILGAMWNDIWITKRCERNTFSTFEIWTNQSGTKILRQIRKTSGSIYDYRDRLVIYEYNANNRISINTNIDNYNGPWTVIKEGEENNFRHIE